MKKTTWGFALNFPETFGDTGKQWIEGRGVVWKALQMDAVIQPPASLDNSPNFGWWLGLVDLLSFAVGEDDIAEHLRNWRYTNYSVTTPLEKFIQANWGESLALLEIYLYLYPTVRAGIFNYVQLCKGNRTADQQHLRQGNELNHFNPRSYPLNALHSDRDRKLARGLFLTDDIFDDRYWENIEISKGSDPAHLGAHFTFQWGESPTELERSDTVDFSHNGHAILFSERYGGWYGKIHSLRRDCQGDPETSGDADRVEVKIAGLGSIGTFKFHKNRNCFVLEGEGTFQPTLATSPRYGFRLSNTMVELLPRLTSHNSSIERVELLTRYQVDLAHSLTYEISDEEDPDSQVGGNWTRIDGEWQEGFVIPDGIHHKRCTAALIYGNHLDLELPWHEAVLEDSVAWEVSPWAIDLITTLWDNGSPVRTVFGRLAELSADFEVTFNVIKDEMRVELEKYIDSFSTFIPASESFLIEVLLDWKNGFCLTAEDLLTAIVDAEAHRPPGQLKL